MNVIETFKKNRSLYLTLFVLFLLLLLAIQGLDTSDWVITVLRGLSTGSVTFLVAAGFSLIFGLMDVLNMAHGTFFMIGAYIAWTVVVRPDTFVDVLPLALVFTAGILLREMWDRMVSKWHFSPLIKKIAPWVVLAVAGVVIFFSFSRYPVTIWDAGDFTNSPATNAFAVSQGELELPDATPFQEGASPVLVFGGIFVSGLLTGLMISLFSANRTVDEEHQKPISVRVWGGAAALLLGGILIHLFNTPISVFLWDLDKTWLFLLAMIVAILSGVILGGLMEITTIRPLYERPIYQLMLTLGLSAIGLEVVRSIWGLQEFTMPRPSIFDGQGDGCPATSFTSWAQNHCATIEILGGRVRTYNEIFIPILGILVLIGVGLLLKKTRLGMIVRAGVQDSEMVEALGINVRRVFTMIFAMGVGLAALGGAVGAPSTGLTTNLGVSLLLNVLIALAIGGLTSYPGAALGSLIVGLLQQFIVKYGQVGINLPFLDEPFKPSPPIVPAATIILMVVILLVMPNGLLGKKEQ